MSEGSCHTQRLSQRLARMGGVAQRSWICLPIVLCLTLWNVWYATVTVTNENGTEISASMVNALSASTASNGSDAALQRNLEQLAPLAQRTTSTIADKPSNVWAALLNESRVAQLDEQCPPRRHGSPSNPRRPMLAPLIIAGAQKAGTTALFYLLQKLHNASTSTSTSLDTILLPSRRVETHFFDQAATHSRKEGRDLSTETTCRWRHKYRDEFDWSRVETLSNVTASPLSTTATPWVVTLEKCPVYTCKPRIPYHIAQVLPHAKIVLMLRNPVERLYSQWYMMKGSQLLASHTLDPREAASLHDTIATEINVLRWIRWSRAPTLDTYVEHAAAAAATNATRVLESQFALPVDTNLSVRSGRADIGATDYHARKRNHQHCGYVSRGLYAAQVYNWRSALSDSWPDQLLVVRYEDFVANRSHVLDRVAAFAGLSVTAPQSDWLDQDYSPRQEGYRTGHFKRRPTENSVPATPATAVRRPKAPPMDPVIRNYLVQFYQPYNDELADLLGDEWRNVWT